MAYEIPSGTINGVNAVFTTTQSISAEMIAVDRLLQISGTDYSISGNTITFVSGSIPQTGATIQIWYTAVSSIGGGSTSPYATSQLLSNAKLRAFYPTSGGVLADSDILRLATDELIGIISAKEMASTQGYYAAEVAVPVVSGRYKYEINYRAMGSKLRYAALIGANGNRTNIRPGRPERFAITYNLSTNQPGTMPTDCWFEDGRIWVFPVPLDATYSIIQGIYARPGRLQTSANATTVTANASAGATSLAVAAIPAYMSGATSIDINGALPPFSRKGFDVTCSGLVTSGTTITIHNGLPYDVAVGDYVNLPEESSVLQLPAEAHPLLAARTARRILQARGNLLQIQQVEKDIGELQENLYTFLSNRNEGQIDTVGTNDLLASGKSRFGFGLGGF